MMLTKYPPGKAAAREMAGFVAGIAQRAAGMMQRYAPERLNPDLAGTVS